MEAKSKSALRAQRGSIKRPQKSVFDIRNLPKKIKLKSSQVKEFKKYDEQQQNSDEREDTLNTISKDENLDVNSKTTGKFIK